VYIPNSDPTQRAFWYKTVKDYLEEKGIPWTTWDYKGGFGLFTKGSNEKFESDLNIPLLNALNFNVPEQHSEVIRPDSVGFKIYDDYLEQGIIEASYSQGTIDYYSTVIPNNDHYCLYWTGGPQYAAISLDFVPDKDFTKLVSSGYALDLLVRGNVSGTKFDIRFLDTKTFDPADHPWRIRTTLTDPTPSWDKRWHHVHIPLNQFTEQGAWDNNTWYNPVGKFDWSVIDRLEIVSEYGPLDNKEIWFDNIMITDQDTSTVLEKGTLGINQKLAAFDHHSLQLKPNPMRSSTTISYYLSESGSVKISIYNMNGQRIKDLVQKSLTEGTYSLQWLGDDNNGNMLPEGIYICRLATDKYLEYCKVIIAAG
jgi:endoglucanase